MGDILVTKSKGHTAIVVEVEEDVVQTKPLSVDTARSFDRTLKGNYSTTGKLHLRSGASVAKRSLAVMPKGSMVTCYGYYTTTLGTKWLYVKYKGMIGFASEKYLKKEV